MDYHVEPELDPYVKPELKATSDDLLHTEALLPRSREKIALSPFGEYNFKSHGNDVLLVIPTDNKDKVDTLTAWFDEMKPPGVKIHTTRVKAATGVGNQPYDEAGIRGACNRITNALDKLAAEPELADLEGRHVGTVIVASIESFLRKTGVERTADYGMIIVHNATTGKTDSTLSQGVTVPVAYIEHAQSFGYEDSNEQHGKVTAGLILERNVDGIDGANWHEVVVGVPRYHILRQAMKVLKNPMADLFDSKTT